MTFDTGPQPDSLTHGLKSRFFSNYVSVLEKKKSISLSFHLSVVKNVVFALISEYNVKTGYSFGTDIITEAPVMISGRGLNLSLFGDRVET